MQEYLIHDKRFNETWRTKCTKQQIDELRKSDFLEIKKVETIIKVYEQLRTGNYNLYVHRAESWEKVNHSEITDFSKIDKDAISTKEFWSECFNNRDFKTIDKFVDFIQKNNY